MKIQLELVINGYPDNRKFLNYWDFRFGDDVCCQIIGDKLFLLEYDDDDNLKEKEISFPEFIKIVELKSKFSKN
jgi:hypothetical protein